MSCGVLEDVGQCLYVFLEGGGDAGAPGAFCVAGVCGRSYWGIKRGEMKGVRMRTLLGGESKISPTRSVICVIADEFRNGPALYSDVMKGLVAIESKGSLPIVRLHLVGRCVGGEVGGFRGRDSSTHPPIPLIVHHTSSLNPTRILTFLHQIMPPANTAPADEDYDSAADSDFGGSLSPSSGDESSASEAGGIKAAKSRSHRKRSIEDSGDEGVVKEGEKKRRKKNKSAPKEEAGLDESAIGMRVRERKLGRAA